MVFDVFCKRLSKIYGAVEASAISRLVFDECFGLSWADLLCGKADELSADEQHKAETIALRLQEGEPVQYVLGVAEFCGRRFAVRPGVLIPRPETEELCRMTVNVYTDKSGNCSRLSILDIGTGSGCIAVTLAVNMPAAEVVGWDISEEALAVARENADRLGAAVSFVRQDALTPPDDKGLWDVIVSNPPYVCLSEKAGMERHVADYEPDLALFVPDDDPLLFYLSIGRYAVKALKPGGRLLMEGNERYSHEMCLLLKDIGFGSVQALKDAFGKERYVVSDR